MRTWFAEIIRHMPSRAPRTKTKNSVWSSASQTPVTWTKVANRTPNSSNSSRTIAPNPSETSAAVKIGLAGGGKPPVQSHGNARPQAANKPSSAI